MRKIKFILGITLILSFIISGCDSPKRDAANVASVYKKALNVYANISSFEYENEKFEKDISEEDYKKFTKLYDEFERLDIEMEEKYSYDRESKNEYKEELHLKMKKFDKEFLKEYPNLRLPK
ncbi:MAG: hypothetical protein C0591_06745 [Marinilabiliales bacterium]|nr:MAG: hypothetical protein C0591_06745 [Marinilabiliales bacterium]